MTQNKHKEQRIQCLKEGNCTGKIYVLANFPKRHCIVCIGVAARTETESLNWLEMLGCEMLARAVETWWEKSQWLKKGATEWNGESHLHTTPLKSLVNPELWIFRKTLWSLLGSNSWKTGKIEQRFQLSPSAGETVWIWNPPKSRELGKHLGFPLSPQKGHAGEDDVPRQRTYQETKAKTETRSPWQSVILRKESNLRFRGTGH